MHIVDINVGQTLHAVAESGHVESGRAVSWDAETVCLRCGLWPHPLRFYSRAKVFATMAEALREIGLEAAKRAAGG